MQIDGYFIIKGDFSLHIARDIAIFSLKLLKKWNFRKQFQVWSWRLERKENGTNRKKRISSVIFLNGLNFLALRTPILVVSFYGFVYRYDKSGCTHLPLFISYRVCRTLRFCNVLMDVSFSPFVISFFVQFFIFYKLDKNFKKSFTYLMIKLKILKQWIYYLHVRNRNFILFILGNR